MSSNCEPVDVIKTDCSQSSNPDDPQLSGDDFDDFADFQEASPAVNEESFNLPSGNQPDSPTDYQSNCEPKNSESPFSPPSPSSSSSFSPNEIAANQPSTKSILSLDNLVNQSFTKATRDCDNYVETENSITSDLFSDKTSQSYKIWETLLNPEESTSFRLNWESSHSFQVFLRSLKINNKNVDDFFISAFDSSSESDELTMSSPVSAASQSSENQIVTKLSNIEISSQPQTSSSPSSSITLPTTKSTSNSSLSVSNSVNESIEMPQVSPKQDSPPLVKIEKTNSSASLSTSSSSSSSSLKPNTDSSEPTNQLEDNQPSTNNQLSNNLLDVTFFLNNPNFMQPCSSPKASVKINESEQSIQNNESAKPLSIISSSSTDPFHNLISHIQDASSMRASTKSQSPQSTTKSTLTPSESTNRIFEELPLLSFMRTKLLMFPMRDSIKD